MLTFDKAPSSEPPPAGAAYAAPPRPLAAPLPTRVSQGQLVGALVVVSVAVVGLWARHGHAALLTKTATDRWAGLAQLSGLLASLVALVTVLVAARPTPLERRYGLDRLLVWHRWLGIAMTWVVAFHVVASVALSIVGSNASVWSSLGELINSGPWMVPALVGTGLIASVFVTSLRFARRRLSYETWYFLHLTSYLGLVLAFGHQLTVGSDLADDRLSRVFWVLLHVAVIAALVVSRWGGLLRALLRGRLSVEDVTIESPDTVSLRVAGPGLEGMRAAAGQWFLVRFATRELWWQAHPYSLSAVPTEAGLRFTIRVLGDASRAVAALTPGTRVVLEGPYGVATPPPQGEKLLLIGGGVGIAPVRALLEAAGTDARPVVLQRARRPEDLVHHAELRRLAARRNGEVLALVGRRSTSSVDPFSAASLQAAVPDVSERVAYLCGPTSLVAAARKGLRQAGVPDSRIHFERSWTA